ncbi:hypothetical protein PGTUg99_003684 [Puccinia graminis f. sp. tritici]|uniref:Uncharacterized protein n=1 Tax=Puccinia graminis f. sp. tritici TaxID=56615 RepID=A0A5B0MMA2_PUCGR|nr:hypothetical protein PGTUg99_003684 [Puccinia graminis f. sp. tritici]
MRRPHHPPKRSRRESSPNTALTSVSDGAAAAATDPIDVDEEQLGESQGTPSASGGPAGANTNQEELSRAQRIARTAVSTSYASYNVPELSNQLDKNGRRMIAYPCKLCGKRINRPTSDSSCSNLLKHAVELLNNQKQSLEGK